VHAVAIRFEQEHNLNVTARMVAIWGFNVFALRDFNDLGGGKNGKTRALDNLRAMSLVTRERQHRRTEFKRTSKSWSTEPNLFRSPRQDSRRASGCDRMCSLVCLPLFFTGRHPPNDACRILFAFATARSLRQRASFVINNLFAGASAQDAPQPPLSRSDLVPWHDSDQSQCSRMSAAGGNRHKLSMTKEQRKRLVVQERG
jgi:hypothetical protein